MSDRFRPDAALLPLLPAVERLYWMLLDETPRPRFLIETMPRGRVFTFRDIRVRLRGCACEACRQRGVGHP